MTSWSFAIAATAAAAAWFAWQAQRITDPGATDTPSAAPWRGGHFSVLTA